MNKLMDRSMKTTARVVLLLHCILVCISVQAADTVSTSEALERFGFDVKTTEVRVEEVGAGLYVLFGAGGNILVSIGDQGVLIVDDQVPGMVPKIRLAIQELGGGEIDFVINTHWHFDHAGGNPLMAEDGSWIVSQANSRQMLTEGQLMNMVELVIDQPAYSHEGLPVITFEDRMQFHFNEEEIDLLHFGPAHTTGDTAVVFRGLNVVHMGDVYNSRYPFIDADNGGDLDGVIRFCEAILREIDEKTVVIPGHGSVGTYQDFEEYISMLKTIRARIATLIADGASLEEVIAAKPSAEWDEEKGSPVRLLDRAFKSMTRNPQP
jgi:cyclase